MKDTLACQSRKAELRLNVFREKPSKQLLMNKVRTGAHLPTSRSWLLTQG